MDADTNNLRLVTEYLKFNCLLLATAESCTAGQMIALLTLEAKQRILQINPKTIEVYDLTSEEVAIVSAEGALSSGPRQRGEFHHGGDGAYLQTLNAGGSAVHPDA